MRTYQAQSLQILVGRYGLASPAPTPPRRADPPCPDRSSCRTAAHQVVEQLHTMNPQHHPKRIGAAATASLRIERLDPILQLLPGESAPPSSPGKSPGASAASSNRTPVPQKSSEAPWPAHSSPVVSYHETTPVLFRASLVAHGASVAAVQVAGRWGSPAMPAYLRTRSRGWGDVGDGERVHRGPLRVFPPAVVQAGCVRPGVTHEIGGDGEIVPGGQKLCGEGPSERVRRELPQRRRSYARATRARVRPRPNRQAG